ncbi:MAG TPA: hypothetical protein VEB63_02050 [Chitinophagaceae bacterium]|nr:hypothetical protein [Chitinophagaceae bacterium]
MKCPNTPELFTLKKIITLTFRACSFPQSPLPRSLYKRLGGYDAISAVADDFIARLATVKDISLFFVERATQEDENSPACCYFFSATGPVAPAGTWAAAHAHAGVRLTKNDWKITGEFLMETLKKFKVPARRGLSEVDKKSRSGYKTRSPGVARLIAFAATVSDCHHFFDLPDRTMDVLAIVREQPLDFSDRIFKNIVRLLQMRVVQRRLRIEPLEQLLQGFFFFHPPTYGRLFGSLPPRPNELSLDKLPRYSWQFGQDTCLNRPIP